jgi:hypothetical protein
VDDPARPPREAGTPVLLALLLAIASAPLLGTVRGWLPATPSGSLALLGFAVGAWAAVVVPALRGAPAVRALECLVVALPFAVALRGADPGASLDAVPGVLAAVAAGAVASSLPAPWRGRAAALAAMLLAAPSLAAGIGVETPRSFPRPVEAALPAGPPGEALAEADLVPTAWRVGAGVPPSLRAGALARTPRPASWTGTPSPFSGATWSPVPEAAATTLPAGKPALRVVGEGPFPASAAATVVVSATPPTHALDLDPFDVVAALGAADGLPTESADALASFARRGGLLVLPWHGTVPEALARRLGPAGLSTERGAGGARPLGLGHVAKAGAEGDVEEMLAAGLQRPAVGTAFDRALAPPAAPDAFPRRPAAPAPRGSTFALLAMFAAAAAVATTLRRVARAATVVALSGLACVAAGAATEPEEPAVARPFLMDLGGPGGRRVEGVFVAAGPRGWAWDADLASSSGLRALGFRTRLVGGKARLVLGPRAEGFLVEESVASGGAPGTEPVEAPPAWTRGLVVGDAAALAGMRWRAGTAPYGGPRPPGIACPEEAWAVVGLPGRP